MKLIKPNYEILQSKGLYEDIEIAARTCYQSQDKIMQGSAEKIVSNLIERGHGAMLEHGTVYLLLPNVQSFNIGRDTYYKYRHNSYSSSKVESDDAHNVFTGYITTNYRVLVENGWLDDLRYQCEPTEFHEKRYSVRFLCDIGVSREFNRHRVDSIAEQSTRYCNFTKEQFGNEITFIQPDWVSNDAITETQSIEDGFRQLCLEVAQNSGEIEGWNAVVYWLFSLMAAEFSYLGCIKNGWTAQQARDCLNLSTKTELIHTAFVSDWKHFFSLRDDKAAHPSARELATPLHEEFKKLNYI